MRRLDLLAAAFGLVAFFAPQASANALLYNDVHSGSMPVVPAYNDPTFAATILAAHNVERRIVGVPDLKWSPELAAEAYSWARVISQKGYLQHDTQRAHGENLWLNTIDHRSAGSMVAGWSIEKNLYIPGAGHPYESRTGNWHDVGHYTQMVWSSTTEVGCAIARGTEKDFLVCRYDPIGNWQGMAAYDPRNAPRVALAEAAPAQPAPVAVAPAAPARIVAVATKPVTVAANAQPKVKTAAAAPRKVVVASVQPVNAVLESVPVPQPKPSLRASAD